MAQRKTIEQPRHTCKDCKKSYDWHNKGADGTMIFCRCRHFEFCKFLKHDYCDHFIHR